MSYCYVVAASAGGIINEAGIFLTEEEAIAAAEALLPNYRDPETDDVRVIFCASVGRMSDIEIYSAPVGEDEGDQ